MLVTLRKYVLFTPKGTFSWKSLSNKHNGGCFWPQMRNPIVFYKCKFSTILPFCVEY
jgi:hypothetical protein